MLVLTRKSGQQVLVDEHIIVTIVAIAGNRVRIGFEAPRTVPVLRAELVTRPGPSTPDDANHDKT